MAYRKGEVQFTKVTDTSTENYDDSVSFWLPHSCDEWVIGTKEDAQNLINDLQKLMGETKS